MLKLLIATTMLLCAFTASATLMTPEVEQAARNVCEKNRLEGYRLDCLRTVNKIIYLDAKATEVCDSLVYDNNRNHCLWLTKNKKHNIELLSECVGPFDFNGSFNDQYTLECVRSVPAVQYPEIIYSR